MQLSKELTTVTTLSKTVALIVFVSLPIIAFLFGMRYQVMLSGANNVPAPSPIVALPTEEPIGCTMEAKICPDGSSVGRTGPNCEFEKCSSNTSKYKCPENDYVDCMPPLRLNEHKTECSIEFLEWARVNCPNFKGAAY